jgi:two-component system NtrC family sensor kinase
VQEATDLLGRRVLTAFAPVAPLGWLVFVELPIQEAYQPLYHSIQRSGLVLLGALCLAALAGIFLARRMTGPIRALAAGAERIGGGDLGQRIAVRTGDELEGLAGRFNDMAERLQESYTDLECKVEARTRELQATLDDLRAAQDRLIQSEKLASLGQLTAGIAHEIKNPLNFVNNFSSLSGELLGELRDLLASTTLDKATESEAQELIEMLKSNLEKVVQHGRRADSIVKNMLLHSREGSGEHRPVDVNALVEESMNLAYHGARAEKPGFNVMLVKNFDPAAGKADIYPQEITRVLLNLISNGFYAGAKRKAELSEPGFEPRLEATTRDVGARVEIRIRDNGAGIPDDVKEKMFNPFFTTKPAGEGTGLGLSLSHDIVVKQHGGEIEVDTKLGEYTEFRIVLPRAGFSEPAHGAHSKPNTGAAP